jgi:hypothetical protein
MLKFEKWLFSLARSLVVRILWEITGSPDFLHRHPEIHTKVGVRIDALRLQNTTPEALEAWFAGLKQLQTNHQVDTADTWNMDEIGTALGVCTNQTVVGSSPKENPFKALGFITISPQIGSIPHLRMGGPQTTSV